MIVKETYAWLKEQYKDAINNLVITDVRLGILLSAVKLSDNSVGVSSTFANTESSCIRKNRRYDAFSPSKINGQSVVDLFETAPVNNVTDTLKMAVLNAISSRILYNGNYKILEDTDPIDLIDYTSKKNVTIVGAFNSYIQKISETKHNLNVLEFEESSLIDEHKKFFTPAHEYINVVPKSDIVVITGLTLVNNTIDGLLKAVNPNSQVIITGPSSSLVPDVLFKHNVSMIGASRITNPDLLFTLVSEAGTGFHLFRYCATKICILNGAAK